jgi:hypothetical protein
MLAPAIENLREAAEFAPAVKGDESALVDMLNSSEELHFASRVLLDPDAELGEEKVPGSPDEMVAQTRKNFLETASNFEKLEDHPNADALANIVAATREVVAGVRAFVKK